MDLYIRFKNVRDANTFTREFPYSRGYSALTQVIHFDSLDEFYDFASGYPHYMEQVQEEVGFSSDYIAGITKLGKGDSLLKDFLSLPNIGIDKDMLFYSAIEQKKYYYLAEILLELEAVNELYEDLITYLYKTHSQYALAFLIGYPDRARLLTVLYEFSLKGNKFDKKKLEFAYFIMDQLSDRDSLIFVEVSEEGDEYPAFMKGYLKHRIFEVASGLKGTSPPYVIEEIVTRMFPTNYISHWETMQVILPIMKYRSVTESS